MEAITGLDQTLVTTEVELKLRINAVDIPRLKHHPAILAIKTERSRTRRLLSNYYDTPQLTLYQHNFTLRVRRMSGHWYQAVKGEGSAVDGLHQRFEWEDMLTQGEPDFTKLSSIPNPALVALFASDRFRRNLKPIFTTDTKRSEWQLLCADGSHVELALDVGNLIIAGRMIEPICEIELEIKSGPSENLFELARLLQADIRLQPENVSKAERGYAYLRTAEKRD
jgi:inorganic triphosphatase YgiF